jgi:SAM-dependent methyltransferase
MMIGEMRATPRNPSLIPPAPDGGAGACQAAGLHDRRRSAGTPAAEIAHLEATLCRLVEAIPFGADPALDEYRASRSGEASYRTVVNRQVRAFLRYRRYVETGTRILDWGCRHAFDTCLVRMVNHGAAIDGCDLADSMVEGMRAFGQMRYTRLEHPWKLPYADGSFDRVIASGVLEHVPFPAASLAELWRVIEPDGYLIITFLPNRRSYTEFASRNILHSGQHHRLYSRAGVQRLLLDHGFEPVETGYHQVMPSLTMGHRALSRPWMGEAFRVLFKLDPWAERVWPLRLFAANLYAVGRRRRSL